MKNEDYTEFLEIVDRVRLIKGEEFSLERAKAWFEELMKFDIGVLRQTFNELCHDISGFPDIAEVFAHAGDLQRDKEWADYHNSPEQVRERELLAKSGNTGPERVAKILSDIKTVGGKA